jgi:hypothetical protein
MRDIMFQRYSGSKLLILAFVAVDIQNHVFGLLERFQDNPDYLSVTFVVGEIRDTVCHYFPTKRCDAERLLEVLSFNCIDGKRRNTTIVTI